MPIDVNNLPISGGVIVAGLLWIGVSAFALAPILAERTALKIGWQEDCEQQVVQELTTLEMPTSPELSIGCEPILGNLPHEQRQLLDMFGVGAACDAIDATNAHKRRLLELRRERLNRAASDAGSKCSCAISHFTMSKRWDLALAAGSARLIVPGTVSNMRASLLEALSSPACAGLAKVEG